MQQDYFLTVFWTFHKLPFLEKHKHFSINAKFQSKQPLSPGLLFIHFIKIIVVLVYGEIQVLAINKSANIKSATIILA